MREIKFLCDLIFICVFTFTLNVYTNEVYELNRRFSFIFLKFE